MMVVWAGRIQLTRGEKVLHPEGKACGRESDEDTTEIREKQRRDREGALPLRAPSSHSPAGAGLARGLRAPRISARLWSAASPLPLLHRSVVDPLRPDNPKCTSEAG